MASDHRWTLGSVATLGNLASDLVLLFSFASLSPSLFVCCMMTITRMVELHSMDYCRWQIVIFVSSDLQRLASWRRHVDMFSVDTS